MDDPYKYFRVEARELVDGLVAGIMDLERSAPVPEVVARMLRYAHTLKGAARVVRLPEIADDAHMVEDVLGPFREVVAPIPADRLDAVLRLLDAIAGAVAALDVIDGGADDEGPARQERRAAGPVRTIRADVVEMDSLLDGIADAQTALGAIRAQVARVERARDLVDLVLDQLPSWRTPATSGGADRGAAGAYMQRVRSLADELRRMLSDTDASLDRSVTQLDHELRGVREAAERLRLVPAAALFTPLERAARDVALALGKQVTFEVSGGDVRLDAHVVVTVQGALEQLVRNAVAHGIESAAERRAAGKAPDGSISLEVTRQGQTATFTCRDDGRGVDIDAVRAAAGRRGTRIDGAEPLDADALLQVLLDGGITTSTTVSELSGRGIGLDVARDAADRLGGRITASTDPGRGATFTLEVPLFLAALRALVVEAGGVTATIPLESVRATARVATSALTPDTSGQRDSIEHDGRLIPFLPLPAAISGRATPPPETGSWSAVILATGSGTAAVGVNRLLGIADVVVRPLPELTRASAIVSGASIDGRGNAQLVLDPAGMVDAAHRADGPGIETRRVPPPILVIDDSLTTRMLEQSILESAGYVVDVAVSGEDALVKATATSTPFGLFLVDVEMPGMDGFTFVERAAASPALRDIPCIFVTSRASPDDRSRGFGLGARAYIAKHEFHQRELLDRIREIIGA